MVVGAKLRRFRVTFLGVELLGYKPTTVVEAEDRQKAVPLAAVKLKLTEEYSIESLRAAAIVEVMDRRRPGPSKFSEVKTYG